MNTIGTPVRKRQRRAAGSWTPPAIARRWGTNVDKPLAFIRRGLLRAVNVAGPEATRPRWAVLEADLLAFEAARSSTATAPVKPQRRRRRDPTIIEYF